MSTIEIFEVIEPIELNSSDGRQFGNNHLCLFAHTIFMLPVYIINSTANEQLSLVAN